jgi:hypothetical protein
MRLAFSRFRKLRPERRKLLIEACLYLIWARALLLIFPFRVLTRVFNRLPSSALMRPDPTGRERLRRNIGWAIERAAVHLPGANTCFPQAMAAQAMCRHHGIAAVLYYGAARLAESGLAAHAWVLDRTDGVIGHQIAADYQVLARFPS